MKDCMAKKLEVNQKPERNTEVMGILRGLPIVTSFNSTEFGEREQMCYLWGSTRSMSTEQHHTHQNMSNSQGQANEVFVDKFMWIEESRAVTSAQGSDTASQGPS